YTVRKVLVNSKSVLKQHMASGGGVAVSVKEGSKQEMKGLKKLSDFKIENKKSAVQQCMALFFVT
ncbi:MAG: hypothetical protein LPK09_13440, partial [Hymenobacteraceae bacterium]|nr:hypothetical protein [Hymenobacteraceae bacterium]